MANESPTPPDTPPKHSSPPASPVVAQSTKASTDATGTQPKIDGVELLDQDDVPVTSRAAPVEIGSERKEVYARRFSQIAAANQVWGVKCTGGRGTLEHLVVYTGDSVEVLMMECKISMEDLSPTLMVEYCFEDGLWSVSEVDFFM